VQNLTVPGGDVKIGTTDYTVRTNSMPPSVEALNDIPVAYQNGATVFLRDIGHVRDGNLVLQNVVRAHGKRSVLISIIKNGNASTLTVVNAVKHMLKIARKAAPPGTVIKELFDQSVFVATSVIAVLREGAITADYGTEVEVNSGVNDGDQVILQPPVNLTDGDKVQIIPEPPQAAP
jgi:multidrug efflux pump subunit AcrB